MMVIWLIVAALSGLLYRQARSERRTLWFGALFFFWLVSIFGAIFYQSFILTQGSQIDWIPLILIFSPFLLLTLSPFFLVIFLIYNGWIVMKKEGRTIPHVLAFFFGIGLTFYYLIFPLYISRREMDIWTEIYLLMLPYLTYFLAIFYFYFWGGVANTINRPRKDFHYIMVLGSELDGDKVTPLLASRIRKAIKVLKKQDPTCQLIMTGGQGPGELISKAQAMKEFAIQEGVNPNRIIVEDKATTTRENFQFSWRLTHITRPQYAIVTSNYHLFRALLIAKELGFPCIGYGAPTNFYYAINAYIREFIGYWALGYRKHRWVFRIILVLQAIYVIIRMLVWANSGTNL